MSAAGAPRPDLVAGIAEQTRRIGWVSERIGHAFAQAQSLHATDFRALTAIYRAARDGHPLTSKALAAELQLSPAAVTYVVERLTASGHVRRDADPGDRRRVLLAVDDPGLAVAASFFGPLGRAHGDALAGFSDADLATALSVLSVIADTLDAFEGRIGDPPPSDG